MKKVFNNIIKRVGEEAEPEDIAREMKETEKKLRRQIKLVFPKIERWSSLATIISTSVIVAGITTGQGLFSGLGAGVAGISQAIDQYIKILKSKNKWVCFKQTDK